MNKLLTILFLFCALTGYRSHVRYYMSGDYVIASPGEYVTLLLDTTIHTPYVISGSVPALISGAPAHTSQIAGGAHHACVIDNLGRVGCFDDNLAGELGDGTLTSRGNIVMLTTDSLGNTLDPFAGVVCGGTAHGNNWATAGWTATGKAFVWGNTQGGNLGNGTFGTLASTRPVQVSFSGGAFITKILSGLDMVALDSIGTNNVWTWGDDGYDLYLGRGNSPAYMVPGKINIGGEKAIDVVGPGFFHFALTSVGHVWAWGDHHLYMGPTLTTDINTPRDITASLGLPFPIAKIRANSESTYFILTDGSLWAMGGNAVGTIGNGVELDFSNYGSPFPYGATKFPYKWSQGQNELMQRAPVQIAPGKHDWVDVYAGTAIVWFAYAIDAGGQLYSWGRNKAGSVGNGVSDPIDGGNSYPNAMDVPWITAVNPLAVTTAIPVSCPYCVANPSGSPCNNYSIPVTSSPNANAGSTQNITGSSTTMAATASGNGGSAVTYTTWSQVSGPNTAAFMFNSSLTSYVGNLITGQYVFQLKVTDQNWRTTTSNVTVNVNITTHCTFKVKFNIH